MTDKVFMLGKKLLKFDRTLISRLLEGRTSKAISGLGKKKKKKRLFSSSSIHLFFFFFQSASNI